MLFLLLCIIFLAANPTNPAAALAAAAALYAQIMAG